LYEEVELREDKAYVAKKLGISVEELDKLIHEKGHDSTEYPNWNARYKIMLKVKNFVQKVLGRNVKAYSQSRSPNLPSSALRHEDFY